jgi:hypothetical protein
MSTTGMMVLIAALVIVGAAVMWYTQRQRSTHLRSRFGPEYDRTREQLGDSRAEAALAARERRVQKLDIRALTAEETEHFSEAWRHIQSLFVDDPKGAIGEADRLVNDVMSAKGYPMADFAQRAADISVDHPVVVEHYRSARQIVERNQAGTASTEDLRQAVIHYRALFDDLLDHKPSEMKPVYARR